jgi:short-subunit dehydrogenase
VLNGTKIALPRFVQRRRGHLVNLASAAGKSGLPGAATYSATKYFVVGLSEAARLEMLGTDIDVSCVMPVVVNTELGAGVSGLPGLGKVEPEDVANEILSTLRSPRFDVYVPRRLGILVASTGLLPRRSREAIGGLLGTYRSMAEVDHTARAGYEARASGTDVESGVAPGLAAHGSHQPDPSITS